MIFLISLPSFRSFFISSFVVIPTYSFLLKPFLLIFFIPSFTLFPPYCTFFVSVFYLYLPLSRTPFLHFLKTASCFTFLYYTSFSYISYPSLFHFWIHFSPRLLPCQPPFVLSSPYTSYELLTFLPLLLLYFLSSPFIWLFAFSWQILSSFLFLMFLICLSPSKNNHCNK